MSEAAIGNAYDAAGAFLRNPQDRMNYVSRQMAIMDYNSGMNAAEKRGEARGETRGEARMAALVQRLITDGRTGDALKASSDAEYRNALYKEMNL